VFAVAAAETSLKSFAVTRRRPLPRRCGKRQVVLPLAPPTTVALLAAR